MISRRQFVIASFGTSVAALTGCRDSSREASAPGSQAANAQPANAQTQSTAAKARLTLYFVGGTAFRRSNGTLTAVQMSGKNLDGSEYLDPDHRRSMPHRSFIVLPAGTIAGVQPFAPNYRTNDLHRDISPAHQWQPICLVGKDVRITHRGGEPFAYRCQQVAEFGHIATNWKHKGQWHTGGPMGPPVNSRFTVSGGALTDGEPQNQQARDREFKVGNGQGKKLSDVAVLTLDADQIDITGLGTDLTLSGGRQLRGFVLAGPENPHAEPGQPYVYRHINHALLLHTLYEIPRSAGDIRPVTDREISETGKDKQQHPCDLGHPGDARARAGTSAFVPPDTEYCVNYDELP